MGRVLIALAAGGEYDPGAIEQTLGLLDDNHKYVLLAVQESREGILPLAATGIPEFPPVVMPESESFEEIEQRAETQGQHYLQKLVDVLHIEAEIQLERGDAAERICTTAAEQDVDLIVIGSSNANFVQRVLRGSTSDQVVHHAPCPVLLIKPMTSGRVPIPETGEKNESTAATR